MPSNPTNMHIIENIYQLKIFYLDSQRICTIINNMQWVSVSWKSNDFVFPVWIFHKYFL